MRLHVPGNWDPQWALPALVLIPRHGALLHRGGSDELIFQEDHDATHPQGNFPAGNYQIWYGEDLDPTGRSQGDNVGTSCVDVYYYIPGTANELSCVDIPMIGEWGCVCHFRSLRARKEERLLLHSRIPFAIISV